MISPKTFLEILKKNNVDFFTGVPDSLLKEFCAYISTNTPNEKHVIAANEGGAVGLAVGHYLSTGKPALIYMQNSGQGNAINPLLSLADPKVYGIPMVLLVGWRGEPSIKDEPQHVKQGEVTLSLFKVMGIPYEILPTNDIEAQKTVSRMLKFAITHNCPVAIIVKKNTFEKYKIPPKKSSFILARKESIKEIIKFLPLNAVIVSTTGHISRELYELHENGHQRDFLTVGSMGHASQIAMGIALQQPKRTVICLDGDGAVLMHLGSLAIIGQSTLKNFKHIVLNNGAHVSVGGQPTVGLKIDLLKIAKACGYTYLKSVHTLIGLSKVMPQFLKEKGKNFLEIKVSLDVSDALSRPKLTPFENKKIFMNFLKKNG